MVKLFTQTLLLLSVPCCSLFAQQTIVTDQDIVLSQYNGQSYLLLENTSGTLNPGFNFNATDSTRFYITSASEDAFITTWNTKAPGSTITSFTDRNQEIKIPMKGNNNNYWVEYQNLNNAIISGIFGPFTEATNITLPEAGQYLISISGDFHQIAFEGQGDYGKIIAINQWGNNPWRALDSAFMGCRNLIVEAKDAPNLDSIADLSYAFYGCYSLTPDVADWDVSSIQKLTGTFAYVNDLEVNLGAWNLSELIDAKEMLSYSGMSVQVYDSTLLGWSQNASTPNNIILGAHELVSCDATGRDKLLLKNWQIQGDTSIICYTPPNLRSGEETLTHKQSIKIYPNPTSSFINIEGYDHEEIVNLQIINTSGQKMLLHSHWDNGHLIIDTNKLSSGFYILKIESRDGLYTEQFVVQR